MCSIFGVYGNLNQEKVADANRLLSHRGPDAFGMWSDSQLPLTLAHNRLSILDLSPAGAQPMASRSQRYVISFNGEIYNFADVKKELPIQEWAGHSDTEILLAAIEHWGVPATLKRLHGMFAFALWDREERNLILARDRLGEKPLYYGRIKDQFVLASQLKPIMYLYRSHLTLDLVSVGDYFRRGCISGEGSIFQEIKKLKPGCYLILPLSSGVVPDVMPRPVSYWSLSDLSLENNKADFAMACQQGEDILKRSISRQMIADVSVGAFLSGGLDSSLIVALMQGLSAKKVNTYTIGFSDSNYNEAEFARAVAGHLKTDHHEIIVQEKDLLAQVPKLPVVYDEPFADSSQIPTLLVSEMASKHVKVALSGDGGDELMAGYNRHIFAASSFSRMQKIPAGVRRAASRGLDCLSPGAWERIFKVIPTPVSQPHEKIYKLIEVLRNKNLRDYYFGVSTHWKKQSPLRALHDLPLADWDVSSVTEMSLADAKWYMADDILVKVDRAAMAYALETRAPFLDHEFVEFSFSLPLSYKIKNGQSKYLARQILYKYVPSSLIERPKMGFGVPLHSWLRNELKDWAWDLLSAADFTQQNTLDTELILKKWHEHQSGTKNWHTDLWDVLMFLAWRRHYQFSL